VQSAESEDEMNDEQLISALHVAKRLGVMRWEVYEWLRDAHNPLPSYQVGTRARRFRWSEVLRWLELRRVA
jgi:excisionase family DNA binding protein